MASLSLVFDLLARDNASRTFRDVADNADRAGKAGEGFGHSIKTGMAIAVGALAAAGIGTMFVGFVKDAQESAKISRLTEAAIKSTGGAAKITADQVSSLATAISNKTAVDDESVQSASNLLLTFTKVRNEVGKGNDIFNQATQAAVDMSVVMGTDANSAALQLGKALNDPVKGVGALTRAGVSFTQQQKDQIGAMVAAGDTLGAQKLILAEMQTQFGGAAAAAADPLERLKVIAGNLGEEIGGALLPRIEGFANFVTERVIPGVRGLFEIFANGNFTADMTAAFGVAEDSGFVDFLFRVREAAVAAFDYVRGTVVPALADFAGWVQRNADVILPFIAALAAGYLVFQTVVAITTAWAAAQAALNAVMAMNPIGLVIIAIAALAAGLIVAYQRSETFRAIIDTAFRVIAATASWVWDNFLQPILSNFIAKFMLLADVIQFAWNNIIRPVWSALVAYLTFLWENIARPYLSLIMALWTTLGSAIAAVYNNVIAPVWGFFARGLDGLKGAFQGAVNLIGAVWDSLVEKVKTPIRVVFTFVNDRMIEPINGLLGKFPGNLKIPLLPRLASGGTVRGPGTATSDSILGIDPQTGLPTAWVSNDEFVVNAKAAKKNRGLLETINAGLYANGGMVGDSGGPLDFIEDIFIKGARVVAGAVLNPLRNAAKSLISGDDVISMVLRGAIDKLVDAVLGKGEEADKSVTSGGGPPGTGAVSGGWRSIFNWVQERVPQARANSTFRPGDPGYHGRGKAVDFGFGSGPGGNGSLGLALINRILHDGLGRNLAELIYDGIGDDRPDLKNGKPLVYNAATRAQHHNHVHAAVYDSGGILPPGLTLAYNGTGRNERVITSGQGARGPLIHVENQYVNDAVNLDLVLQQAQFRERMGTFG